MIGYRNTDVIRSMISRTRPDLPPRSNVARISGLRSATKQKTDQYRELAKAAIAEAAPVLFDLGFATSGEGWNGECGTPGIGIGTEHYKARRQQVIDAALRDPPDAA